MLYRADEYAKFTVTLHPAILLCGCLVQPIYRFIVTLNEAVVLPCVFLLGLLLGRIFFDALVRGSSRISERLRFHPYVLVVFRASILPGPGVKEQTSIYPKREVNVADVILD